MRRPYSTNAIMAAVAALTVVAISAWLPAHTEAAALPNKRCGAQLCDLMDYCSPLHDRCEPCELVCNATNGHFDRQICNSNCESEWQYILLV